MDFTGIIKTALDRLSFSIGLASCVASGFAALSPWMNANLDPKYLVIAWIVFVFSSVWVVAEIGRWASGRLKSRKRSITAVRGNLYMDIYQLQKKQGGLGGSRWVLEQPFEVASEIADKYARLNKLGIKTPEINPAAGEWDFDLHNQFLTAMMPFLTKSPMKEVKAQARKILRGLLA
ncbi:hypothetical protein KUV26_20595 [Leisingera daeponensis]|uniref:Uncharacterized protein n=1 Tax=Leisingera daeponensis TaxID=405746 RepID=A0ABS7NKX5_9RHOB|nr:hypothetical protein [Leisingera daeponensis]MBY6141842.1 hypothetical protein [Leisingera daeponensis]